MRKAITLLLSLAIILVMYLPASAAARADYKEDDSNPEIKIEFNSSSTTSETIMSISSDTPGILYINSTPYASNKTYNVKFINPNVDKTNLKDRFVTGTKVYGLHEIYQFTPPIGSSVGKSGETFELIYAREAGVDDMGSSTSTNKNTIYDKQYSQEDKAYTDKYYIDSKETTESQYISYRSQNSCKESISTKLVNSSEPVLINTVTDEPVVTCSVDSNCVGQIKYETTIHQYYKVTHHYLRTHSLETVSTPDTGDYTGTLKIDAVNYLPSQVDVTGEIELSDKVNFSSERFNIVDGKGTFKTNSLSRITLNKLLKGQTYKISNVKAGDYNVSISPATGTVDETVVKVTLTKNETTEKPEVTTPEETKPAETKPEEQKPSVTTPEETKPEEASTTVSETGSTVLYLNTVTGKFHTAACRYSTEKNVEKTTLSAAQLTAKGYSPCQVCHPDSSKTEEVKPIEVKPVEESSESKDYTGYIQIDAVNYLPNSVVVTGDIEFSEKFDFTSARFKIVNGKGTFTTNSLSRITLTSLLKGQTYKISNVKASGYSATVDNASGIIGKNTVKITLKKSSGNVSKSLPTVSMKTPAKTKTSITVKWNKLSKKQQKQISGIQVQYSKNKNFKSAKQFTVKKTSTAKKISKLSRKTTYYARVRTYKKNGNSKVYGSWSKVKKVKTK